MKQPLLIVLTGLSGSGKTTLCMRFLQAFKEDVERVITTTSRQPRSGETHGKDYYFETRENFLRRIEGEEFFEYAKVYENFYGVSKNAILSETYANKDLIICMDVQGAQTLKKYFQAAPLERRLVTVFVAPATLRELEQRLATRGTDDEQTIQKRLQTAERELSTLSQFDYHLCSRDREHDWLCLQHIYFAEKMRI